MMREVHATVRGGRIEADGPIEFPEGTRVVVRMAFANPVDGEAIDSILLPDGTLLGVSALPRGRRDARRTPEQIAEAKARWAKFSPPPISDEEFEEMERDRLARKAAEREAAARRMSATPGEGRPEVAPPVAEEAAS